MELVLSYKIAWNTSNDEGTFLLSVKDNVRQLHVDSASEASLILDILRHEKPVFVQDNLIFTGFEPVGEGENDTSGEMNVDQASENTNKDGSANAYKITWNTKSDEGVFMVVDKNGAHQILVDSAPEGMLMLNLLRNEQHVFVDNNILMAGFDNQ
jgi:hypothetical protein